MKTDIQLPSTHYELVELAIKDLEACEADPKYIIDMGAWHEPHEYKDTCSVCLAGSVLAKTFEIDSGKYATPYKQGITKHDTLCLKRLDEMRAGQIWDDIERRIVFAEKAIPTYKHDPAGFKARMIAFAIRLDTLGHVPHERCREGSGLADPSDVMDT